jgi:diacylglycerol kinase (CTP)
MSSTQTHGYDSSIDKVLHKRSDLHLLRKLWHISTGSMALFLFFRSELDTFIWAVVALLIAVGGFTMDLLRARNQSLNHLILKVMGPLMRRSEKEGMSGLPFYALGISLALFFYKKELAVISIMFLVFSDPISSFFGVLYGKDKILPNKSLQGAVAGFFTCYLITLFYCMNTAEISSSLLIFAVAGGVIGSLSELVSAFNIDDNLTIPVLSGLGLTLVNYFIPLFQ